VAKLLLFPKGCMDAPFQSIGRQVGAFAFYSPRWGPGTPVSELRYLSLRSE
jgi:hypothetical protein